MSIKLLMIRKSHKPEKKYDAIFEHDGRKKVIPFGAAGMSDFTKHGDIDRRDRYDKRHRVNENWYDPMTAGALSKNILWNKPTLTESLTN
jgi:hypothetical protein